MCSDFGRGSAHLFESPANDIVPISVRRAVILRGSTEPFGFIASVELLQLDPSRGNQRKHGGSFVKSSSVRRSNKPEFLAIEMMAELVAKRA